MDKPTEVPEQSNLIPYVIRLSIAPLFLTKDPCWFQEVMAFVEYDASLLIDTFTDIPLSE